jgi:hypothetical protein
MQDFDIDFKKQDNSDELKMQVSSVCNKDGKKKAYVTFSDGKRFAEGEIPECVIGKNQGFTDKEVTGLEFYMKQNLKMLKSMAATVNPIKALMK